MLFQLQHAYSCKDCDSAMINSLAYLNSLGHCLCNCKHLSWDRRQCRARNDTCASRIPHLLFDNNRKCCNPMDPWCIHPSSNSFSIVLLALAGLDLHRHSKLEWTVEKFSSVPSFHCIAMFSEQLEVTTLVWIFALLKLKHGYKAYRNNRSK